MGQQTHIHFIMYCRGSLISVVPSHDWGGDDVVEKVPMNDTITQDSIAFYGYESIIEVLICRAVFASEWYSMSLDGERFPEGT